MNLKVITEDIAPATRTGRKYQAVIDGARQIFMANGFEGASVDDIARAAKVSKATIYSYFDNKEALFMRVAGDECLRQLNAAKTEIDHDTPAQDVLNRAACLLLRFNLSDFGQSIYRICVAESARFPALGRLYYETGPGKLRADIAGFLEKAVARGELVIAPDELELAANQFVELCRATLFHKRIFFVQQEASQDEIEKVCNGAVRTFMSCYGA